MIDKEQRGKAALEHAQNHGLKVFPLVPGLKTPALDKWPAKATTDAKQIRQWWDHKDYNIGIAGGSTMRLNGEGILTEYFLVIVDYDMKPGQKGQEALDQHTLLGYTDTLTAKSPHGIHKYYWSTTRIPNSQSKLMLNVDIRGHHGYVVGPSSTVEGVDYEWLPDFKEIADFPAEHKDALIKASGSTTAEHSKAPIGALDQPHAIALVKEYLINDAPEAIEGSHGDETTYRVAARIKDFGLSEQECLDQMLAHWNEEKAIPPWAYDALRTKVSNAYRYGQNPPGSTDPLNEFELTDEPILETKTTKDPAIAHWTWFDHAADEALKSKTNFLIEDLLSKGDLSVLYGQSGTGKSFVALDLSHAIASGRPWNGYKTTQGLVIYVAAEGQGGIGKRLRALRLHRQPKDAKTALAVIREPINLMQTKGENADIQRMMRAIRAAEKQHGSNSVLIVFDTLSRVLAGADENSSVDMGGFVKIIGSIMHETKAHVLLVHHAGKDMARGARGWSGIKAALDTEIEIHDDKLRVTKQREMDEIRPVNFALHQVVIGQNAEGEDVTSCVVNWGAAAEAIKTELTPPDKMLFEQIVECLKKNGADSISAKMLTEFTEDLIGLSAAERKAKFDTMRKKLGRLEEYGHLKDSGHGEWEILQ